MGNTAFPLSRFQKAGATTQQIATLQQAWALMSPEAQAAENLWIEQVSDSEVLQIASFPSGGGVPTLSGGIIEVSGGGQLATGDPVSGATASSLLAVDASGNLESGPPTQGVTDVSDKAEQLLALLNGPDPAVLATATAGAPTTGTWMTNQAIVDSNGLVWECTAGGAPGTWKEGASGSGGGGSSTPPAITALGSQSGTYTMPSPNTGDLQTVTMTGDLTLTLPAAPPAGETLEFDLIAYQGPSAPADGYVLSFTPSYASPAGSLVEIATQGAANWVHLKYDGTEWNVFPVTSGPTVVSMLAADILGDATGLGSLRIMGSQSTGSAPTYSSPAVDDVVLDSSVPCLWVCTVGGSTPTWVKTGSGGGGGSLPSGSAYQGLGYNSSAAVVAEARQLVDMTSQSWLNQAGTTSYNVGTAVTDNAPGIVAAAYRLYLAGKIGYLPPGTYEIQSQIVFGDGSSTALSTWQPYIRGGGVPPVNTASNDVTSTIRWTGANSFAGAMVVMQGPFQGWEFSGITIDGNNTLSVTHAPALGLQLISVQSGRADFLNVWNTQSGIQHTTVGVKSVSGVSANCSINNFRRVNVQLTGGASPSVCYGVQFTNGSLNGGNGNCCYENYDDLSIQQTTGTGASGRLAYGVYFQCCDSVRIRTLHISNGGLTAQICYDYTNYNLWPAGTVIDGHMELGGAAAPIYETGTPGQSTTSGGSAKNMIVVTPSTVNGTSADPTIVQGVSQNTSIGTSGTLPLVTNTTWGDRYIHGEATLSAGTKNVNCKFAVTGTPVEVFPVALAGTPGQVQGVVSANGTIALTSYQFGTSGTVQTADTGTYYWRLIR